MMCLLHVTLYSSKVAFTAAASWKLVGSFNTGWPLPTDDHRLRMNRGIWETKGVCLLLNEYDLVSIVTLQQ